MTPEIAAEFDTLRQLLEPPVDRGALREALNRHRAADIAEFLAELSPESARDVWDALRVPLMAGVLAEVSEEQVKAFVEDSSVERIAAISSAMPVDEAADLLGRASPTTVESILALLPASEAMALRRVRAYESDTAGGIMTTEFLSAGPSDTARDVLQRIGREHQKVETVERIFVLDDRFRFQGVVGIGALIGASGGTGMRQLMETGVVSVTPYFDQETCAKLMERYNLRVLPVVDQNQRMLGIITVDDVLEVMEDEASEDLYRLAGLAGSEPLERNPLVSAYRRIPWLMVTLVAMSALGGIISRFQLTLERVVALSFFIPAIMGLSGNTGIQSAAVTLRGLATQELRFKRLSWVLKREVLIALMTGIVCSLVLGIVAWVIFSGVPAATERIPAAQFGLTVGVALFCGIVASSTVGTVVPIVCERLGVDPAVASGPLVTSFLDIGSQAIYLGIATWLLFA